MDEALTSVEPMILSELIHNGTNSYKPLLVRVRVAARMLAVSERTIRRLVACGQVEAVGRGSLRRITVASLEAYAQQTGEPLRGEA